MGTESERTVREGAPGRGCPDENLLNRFVSGQLDGETRRKLEEHLDACAECVRVVAAMAFSTAATAPDARVARPGGSGAVVGRYRIEAMLGEGGMGSVFLAVDEKLDRRVALKVIRGEAVADPAGRARATREAKTMAKLAHPNVVAVYDTGVVEDGVFIAMELVDGMTLADWLAVERRTPASIVQAFVSAGRGLAAAHAVGVVHRDFKPSNVMVGRDGRVAVTDFGLARASATPPSDEAARDAQDSGPASTLTRPGTVLGTPRYMSPEQRLGANVDARSDEYSFALALYMALFDTTPFAGDTPEETRDAREQGRLRDATLEARAGVPPGLRRALRRALAPDPADRYPTLAALLDEIAPFGAPVSRHRIAMLVAAGLATAAAVAGGAAWLGRGAAPAPGSPPPVSAASAGAPDASPPGYSLAFAGAPRRLTSGQCEEYPSLTPDGRTIVYDAAVGSDSMIFRVPIEGGSPTALTHGKGWAFGPSVSPGGDRYAYVYGGEGGGSVMVAPLDGHEAPRRLGDSNTRPSWSPDGRGVWVGSKTDLVERDADTGAELRVLHLDEGRPETVLELPDSTVVASVGMEGLTVAGRLVAFRPGNPAPSTLVDGDIRAMDVAPSGDLLVGVRAPGGVTTLLDVRADRGTASVVNGRVVVTGGGMALTRDGRRFVWSTCDSKGRFVAVGRAGGFESILPDEEDVTGWAPIPRSPDVLVNDNRDGKPGLRRLDLTGTRPDVEIPVNGERLDHLAVSHDGAWLALSMPGTGLSVQPLAGAEPARPITTDPSDDSPAFRFGDHQVLFTRRFADGTHRVMSVSVDGGDATPLLEPGSDQAACSPTADLVVYRGPSAMPMLWDARSGASRPLSRALPGGAYVWPAFSADGRRVAVVRGPDVLLEVDVASGAIVRTVSGGGAVQEIDLPGYTSAGLVARRLTWAGSLWVADLER